MWATDYEPTDVHYESVENCWSEDPVSSSTYELRRDLEPVKLKENRADRRAKAAQRRNMIRHVVRAQLLKEAKLRRRQDKAHQEGRVAPKCNCDVCDTIRRLGAETPDFEFHWLRGQSNTSGGKIF